jgi:hypothetical protein
MKRCVLVVALFLSMAATKVDAQSNFEYWPDANYDPAVPTIESVVGHAPGDRITWAADAIRYFDALAAALPDQVVVIRYAKSWEGRELIVLAISSPENISRLDAIKEGMQRLADPRETSRVEAAEIIASQPAVTWLSYGVHGDEISSTDASMMTAYHLLASRGDARAADILANTVVVIDPMQNPDGRDRFIHHFEMSEGLVADSDRISAEHDEPWPGGRTNHYFFDLNRDWFIQTQPETIGRTREMLKWYPVAFVDAHEMGSDGTYYFSPEAIPYNPHLADDQRASLELFGKNNARWFDHFGFDYFTREVFDAFFPGYGASWPSYFGSIAMTYEQASARGLVVRKYDGVDMHFRDTVRNHFVTSLGTAETVSVNREKFLNDFYEYRVSAIAEGQSDDIRAYILPTQADQPAVNKLVGLLVRQGVEVGRATDSFSACGTSYDAGSFVVRTDQPSKRFIRTLMDINVSMESTFLAEQERRRAKNLPDEIYDVTAWSLPLMMNVRADNCGRSVSGNFSPAGPELVQPGTVSGATGSVAYLVPWGTAPGTRFLTKGLRAGLAIKSSDAAFTHDGNRYPSGTLIVDAADNPVDSASIVLALAESTGANVVAVDSSWVTDGPNFGSAKVVRFSKPRVAMAWDQPTSSNSAGNSRFIIERQFDYPVTPIRTRRIASTDLDRYQVLILPGTGFSSDYASVLGEQGSANLKDWVNRGGVLIGLGNANRYLADPAVDLLSIRREDAVVDEALIEKTQEQMVAAEEEEPETTVAGTYLADADAYYESIAALKGDPDSVAGVLARADVDPDHWLSAGVAPTLNVLVRGSDVYTPIRLDKGVNVARFAGPDEVLTSGYLWEENRRQLAYKPFAVVQSHGNGIVVGFTQDPTVRAYLDGLNVILLNAIFRGSAHARPVR